MMKRRVAVVGGGMAGLELAAALVFRGAMQVELIERGPALRSDHVLWDVEQYPGDEKIRRWTGAGWGPAGGLSERLGGRSLCYHGVFLGIEGRALGTWPSAWIQRFGGADGYYRSIPAELETEFPELRPNALSATAEDLGMRHVPQAVRFVDGERRLKVYTPLTKALGLAESGALEILRAAAVRLEPGRDGSWTVDVVSPDGTPEKRGPFDVCVLASSAIGNVQLLSRTLDREVRTNLTDHLCVGGLVRLSPGPLLNEFRHRKLWSGYVPMPGLDANVFVRESEPFPNGDRFLNFHAVVEQDCSDEGSSTLVAAPRCARGETNTHITPTLSPADKNKLSKVRQRIHDLASSLGGRSISGRPDANTWDHSRDAIERLPSNSIVYYQLPYGEYEHESSTHPIGGSAIGITTDLEVSELPEVYVAGPGAFPRIGAANPALTILALSRSLAAMLSVRHG